MKESFRQSWTEHRTDRQTDRDRLSFLKLEAKQGFNLNFNTQGMYFSNHLLHHSRLGFLRWGHSHRHRSVRHRERSRDGTQQVIGIGGYFREAPCQWSPQAPRCSLWTRRYGRRCRSSGWNRLCSLLGEFSSRIYNSVEKMRWGHSPRWRATGWGRLKYHVPKHRKLQGKEYTG